MPRPEHPPTPASSTEIRSKDGSQLSSLQTSFELPPPAVADMEFQSSSSSAATLSKSSGPSHHPASPNSPPMPASEAVKTRRRSSVAQAQAPFTCKDATSFALPPPPTRSRKIIQMKPKPRQAEETGPPTEIPKYTSTAPRSTAPPKKKQPSSTSVAGRKIARKTAHSLIERRRRSKINDEFGVLKDMIPACTGEMHKLSILQASIDYVRYLEDCITKLKAENNRANPTPTSTSDQNKEFAPTPPTRCEDLGTPRQYTRYEEDGDIEMLGSEIGTEPTYTYTPKLRPICTSTSPVLAPQENPYSPISTSSHSHSNTHPDRHYSFSTSTSASTTTSPALGPSISTYDHALPNTTSASNSTLTSPTLPPQQPQQHSNLELAMDQEATLALLMLNTDRRGTGTGTGTDAGSRTRNGSRGGMSVRDLMC
ncbi:Sterol regulatory element-binding protein [Lachnellula willkommii]|uniref:Sterol regulatory element-binding protein n=1 Tax=Lachnellula willkommii TaxID=215461 RepID=A0A559M447_9HELO|nr:Sterol regulatory element-binding protein [Lachnellula willkommii]